VGGSRQVAASVGAYKRRLADFRATLFGMLDEMHAEVVEVPSASTEIQVNAVRYMYQVDPARLTETVRTLFENLVGAHVAGDFATQAQASYQAGAATADRSLRTLLDDTRDLTRLLRESPFLQRVAFVKARVFEEMKGFTSDTASRLGAVLMEGLADGRSIAHIKSVLAKEFGVSVGRARTIARTEVIGALRRGRIEQAQSTAEELGVEIGMMWFSALSSTTRVTHAERHGKVFTPAEVKQFYTEGGNAINCKCSQVEVIMKDGKPLQQKLVGREDERRRAYLKEG